MSDNSGLLVTNNSTAINAISRYIYQTIVSIQKQHPELITSKYKSIPWQDPKYQSTLTNKFRKGLSHVKSKDALKLKVKNYLQIIFTPEFINSAQYDVLISEIDKHIYSEITLVSSDQITNYKASNFSTNGTKLVESGIAILLLDVENLPLDLEAEKILVDICNYPIQIKVAFADLKMATVGASIFLNYPKAKEILVCSSDRGLTHLGTTLQSHGLTVYQVRKYKNQITVLNSKTGESKIYALSEPEIPSINKFIIQLQELIRTEAVKIGQQWIKFSRISALYKETYKLNLKDVVQTYFPSQNSNHIFINYPVYFALHKPSEKSQTYVSIFNQFKPEKKKIILL